MNLLLIALLTLLSGVFSMTEIAVVSSRRLRIEALAAAGDRGAQAVLRLQDNPTLFFSTIQMGNTTVALLNGIVGEGAFGEELGLAFERTGLAHAVASALGTAVVVMGVTFITIVFGELVAKRIGQSAPESIARWMARPILLLATVAKPAVALLALSTNLVLRLLRVPSDPPKDLTEAELQAQLEHGVDAGLIEEHEHQMVQNVFHLDDRPLTSLMVPRSNIDWFEATATVAECLRLAAQGGEHGTHSWYPVCRGGLDDVVGIISIARLLQLGTGHEGPIEPHAQPATFVPETLTAMALLEQLRQRTGRMVFVVDEYGVVQGLLTPHDLLEAITGELQPQGNVQAWATPREDGSWLLDGLMPVQELKSRLDIQGNLPDEGKDRYNTLAGLLMAVSGHLPAQGERIECGGWQFEVVDLEGRRIDKIIARRPDKNPS